MHLDLKVNGNVWEKLFLFASESFLFGRLKKHCKVQNENNYKKPNWDTKKRKIENKNDLNF